MSDKKTFVEWLNYVRKPSEMELILREWKRLRPCKGGCGKMIDGCCVNELCTECFGDWLDKRVREGTILYH